MNSPSRQSLTKDTVVQGCHGEQFTEIYLKRETNVQCIIDVLEDYDFRVRRPAIKVRNDCIRYLVTVRKSNNIDFLHV